MRRTCTQCGTCLEHCPVYRLIREEQASPKAKHLLIGAVEERKSFSWSQILHLTRLCAGCGRCSEVCPLNLSVPDTLAASRAAHTDWTAQAWKLWIEGSQTFWPLVEKVANAVPEVGIPSKLRPLVMPAKAMRQHTHPRPWITMTSNRGKNGKGVALFSGCTAKAVRPQWISKAESLLRKAGYTIDSRSHGFNCCGSTLHHAGLLEASEQMQKKNIALWESMGRPRIAVFCASCQHSLETYPDSLFADTPQAEDWKRSVAAVSTLLLEEFQGESLFSVQADRMPRHVVYYRPCHRNREDPDQALLKTVLSEFHIGKELCCGMGGVLKLTHASLSAELAQACWRGLTPEGPKEPLEALSGCSGCVLQLEAFAEEPNRAWHWLDVVDVE